MTAAAGTGLSANPYDEKRARILAALSLQPVDRIPIIFMGTAFAPRYVGMTMAKFCSDPWASFDAHVEAADKLGEIDGFNSFPGGLIGPGLSALWLSRIALPGGDLPEDSLWQVREAEVMGVDEYDTILEHGWAEFLAGYLPRVIDAEQMAVNVTWMTNERPEAAARLRERGYPSIASGGTTIPFEPLCGARSMPEFFADLYRRPEKVKAVMDVMLPDMIEMALAGVGATDAPGAWVGGWRSASALLAPKIWNELVFPYFHAIVTALAEKGVVSVLHLDQDWTRDLARLRELPAKACVLNPDGFTDVRRAKELLGDHMAIMGDVPATLFATGTPDDIFRYVEELVRDVGPTGLLLCPGCDAPINTKPENMEAFVAAGREFGTVG